MGVCDIVNFNFGSGGVDVLFDGGVCNMKVESRRMIVV